MSRRILSGLLCPAVAAFFLLMSGQVYAATNHLQPEVNADQEKEEFLQGISLVVLYEEPVQNAILCFDVNEEGCVVLGYRDGNNKTVCVYSSDREFLYGYSFSAYGDFSVSWKETEICIFFARGKVAASFNRYGDCTGIERIKSGSNASFILEDMHATEKMENGCLYWLEKDIAIGDEFSRLKIQNSEGIESVFYDATSSHYSKVLPDIICIIAALLCVIWVAIRRSMKHSASNENGI